jgi:molecular chaperone GrpE (heat shock protein)
MIDFKKELEKYDFFAVGAEFAGHFNETARVIEAVAANIRRIGKEISNANIQLEEILSHHTEEKEKDRYIAEQKGKLASCGEEKLSLVRGLVAVVDQLEDIYRYALKNEQDGWSRQMRLLWHETAAILLRQGITRIEGENALFDPWLHAAVLVKEDNSFPGGMVLEVLRCGYIYRSELLRKAQVIVNKTDGGRESNGCHTGD